MQHTFAHLATSVTTTPAGDGNEGEWGDGGWGDVHAPKLTRIRRIPEGAFQI